MSYLYSDGLVYSPGACFNHMMSIIHRTSPLLKTLRIDMLICRGLCPLTTGLVNSRSWSRKKTDRVFVSCQQHHSIHWALTEWERATIDRDTRHCEPSKPWIHCQSRYRFIALLFVACFQTHAAGRSQKLSTIKRVDWELRGYTGEAAGDDLRFVSQRLAIVYVLTNTL